MTLGMLTGLLLTVVACRAAADAGAVVQEVVVVEVLVSVQEYDSAFPWQSQPARSRRGFGVMLDDVHLVTAETLVRQQTLIEVRRPRSGRKAIARLLQADAQINLALLALEVPARPVPAITFAPVPPAAGTVVDIVQITPDGERQQEAGRIVQWKVDDLPDSPYSALTATVITDLNIDAVGAAVFADDCFAGLALGYNTSARTAQMLPSAVIAAFVDDVRTPPYQGMAFAGFSWQPLIDDTKRRYVGLPADIDGGIQVLGVFPDGGSCRHPLRANDVVLDWDGVAVDSQGYYEDPSFGRLLFTHLIKGRRSPGDAVPVRLMRDRVMTNATVTLRRFDDAQLLVPENVSGHPDAFLVDGGFIIRELTGRLLKAAGEAWVMRTDPRLAHLYITRQSRPAQPGDRIVFLAAVLPDPVNIGYQHLRDEIIDTANGVPVRNLRDVFQAVDGAGGLFRLGLRGFGVDLMIDPAAREAANQRIASQYRIPFMRREPSLAR